MKQTKNILYYLILSIVAALLLVVLTFFSSSNISAIKIHDKLIVGVAFISSCVFGISLVRYPGWLKRVARHDDQDSGKKQTQKTTVKYRGHHPNCGKFQSHTITTKNKTYCAGCLGLAIGSLISIALMIIHILFSGRYPSDLFYFLIFLGFIIISVTYIEIVLPLRYAVVHVVSNIFLVIGFLLVTISITEITGDQIYGLICVLLSFLWLDTRIQLSNGQHERICRNCTESCKMY